jgi:exonuclease III
MATLKTLTFLSLNVRGLNNSKKRKRVFQSLKYTKGDVFFLQETFITSDKKKTECAIDWDGHSEWHLSNKSNSRGAAILFKSGLNVKILGVATDLEGRYLLVDCSLGYNVSITKNQYRLLNVYLPNIASQREAFLKSIQCFINSPLHLVIGGDFNFVEDINLDKINGSNQRDHVDNGSRRTINKIKNDGDLVDVFRTMHPTLSEFTFTSSASHTGVRSDRFYLSTTLMNNVSQASHTFITDCDHRAVQFSLITDEKHFGPGYWKCNVKTLRDEHFQADLKALYSNLKTLPLSPQWWDGCKLKFKRLIINHSCRLAANHRSQINKLNNLVGLFQQKNLLQRGRFTDKLDQLKTEIKVLLDSKIEGAVIRAKAMHLGEDDKPSHFFLKLEKKNGNSKTIHSLVVNGMDTTDQAELEYACREYYSTLLKKNNVDESAWNELMEELPSISKEDSALCDLPVTYEECKAAINQMADHKSPGSDGLPAEFYKLFFYLFGTEFVWLINNHTGLLSDSQRIGIITLICKNSAKASDLGSWRPISLLNVDLKIISKVVLNKLKLVAQDIVGREQTCGVPKRSIFDNLHFLRNVFDYCKDRDLPCVALCFDQAKAFDSVDHSYLVHTLNKLGLGSNIIGLIKLLYNNIYSSVMVNGYCTEPFSVSRSMRQGCGLSPLLYAFCIEPLINKIRTSLLFKGIPMPSLSKTEARVAVHADDSTVLAADSASVTLALDLFHLYGRASGARLNYDKSVAYVPAKIPPLAGWPSWLKTVDSVKICGIVFGRDAQSTMEMDLKDRIDRNLSILRARRLTHIGRVVVINNIILAKVWYVASVTILTNNFLTWLQSRIFGFLWPTMEKIKRQTAYLPITEGGLGLINITAKCHALLTKHASQLIEKPDINWAVLASYWTALPLRQHSQVAWSNIVPHATTPNHFYKEVISDFKFFKTKYPLLVSPLRVSKMAYDAFMRDSAIAPRILTKMIVDRDLIIKCWKDLSSLPISAVARDLLWQASHGILQVASRRFQFHLAIHNICARCHSTVETIEHALVQCPSASPIWDIVNKIVPDTVNMTATNILYLNSAYSNSFDQIYSTTIISEAVYLIWLNRNKKCFEDQDTSYIEQVNRFKSILKLRIMADRARLDKNTFFSIWSKRPLELVTYPDGNIKISVP